MTPPLSLKLKPMKPRVLIIEGDADTLARQGLSRAHQVAEQVRVIGGEPDIWKVNRSGDLWAGLLSRAGQRYRAVVVVGHGCTQGVQLCADAGITEWSTLGGVLSAWKPASVGFISCSVGRSMNARILFTKMPSLKEVIASKTVVSAVQASLLPAMVSRLVWPQRFSDDAVAWGQGIYALATGGVLARYERRAVLSRSIGDQLVVSIAEEILTPMVEEFLADLHGRPRRRYAPKRVPIRRDPLPRAPKALRPIRPVAYGRPRIGTAR